MTEADDMCGIAGFLGVFDETLLHRMSKTIRYRGPDDAGVCVLPEYGLGLAHRRLSIIDLSSSAHQPMWDATHTVVISYNGEIYNYRELRADLIDEGFSFHSHSDTEVLLNLHLRDGPSMLSLLNGIFAFALWDTRTKELLLARDGVGVKPLYYSQTPKGFLFASELKAILQEPGVNRTIEPKALHAYLTYLWCPAPRTMLKSVKKLEPGYALIVKNGSARRQWQYYDLPYHQSIETLSEQDAIDQTRAYITRAVERQMVADVPVGAFLSGGLDSSTIVACTRHIVPDQPLQCFTIGFQGEASHTEGFTEDLPYAQSVAEHLGVKLNVIHVGPDMVGQLETMLYHLDEPQGDPAPINALFISRLAEQHGIKVLLSGAGGDDVFAGYRRHYALMLERYWTWLPEPVRRLLRQATRRLPADTPLGRRLSKVMQYAHLQNDERLVSYFYWIDSKTQFRLYTPAWHECIATSPCENPLIESLSHLSPDVPALNRMLYLEGKHFLADHNLNYTDKMGMARGVEIRVPFLDPDLIAFAARLPLHFKQRGRVGKWILKKAMEPYLPANVIYRPKTGFGVPLRHWIRHELRPVIDDVLSEASLQHRGIFDPKRVQQLITRNHVGKVDGAYTIFSIICIELWCRIFIDSSVPKYAAIA